LHTEHRDDHERVENAGWRIEGRQPPPEQDGDDRKARESKQIQPERSELRRGIAADFTRSRRGSYALSPDRSRVTRARPAASTLAVLIRGSATSGGSRQVDRAVVNRADGGGDRVVERERRA